jgi:aminoglycoside phosphotransferase family enzyme
VRGQILAEEDRKLAFLRRPDSYPDRPDAIRTIETHFAWVFLSRRYVYKLKKPVCVGELDLTTVQARRANCELELALNRRLAADTYIGIVPLGLSGDSLMLEAGDSAVDWLVKMHRLADEDNLERLLPGLRTDDARLTQLIDTLCEFYGRSHRATSSGPDYRRALALYTERLSAQLALPALANLQGRILGVTARQHGFIERHGALLEQRVDQQRVLDAHGDLRPEHVFMTAHPQIIDCLEFSAELRQLDSAEEVCFLALECERLGRRDIGSRLLQLYVDRCSDRAPQLLLEFYRSRRALVRAFLSAWRLEDGLDVATVRRWLDQAAWYVRAAEASVALLQ